MLILRILLLILMWHVSNCAQFSLTKNANNYGPYVLFLKKYEECKGPKAVNVSTITVEVSNEADVVVSYKTKFLVDTRMSEFKIYVWHVDGIQKTILWNYKVDKPCQHYAITSVIAKHMPLQPNCIVKKGEFNFTLNYTAIARQFFGESFFYGEFLLKVVALANQGNVMCVFFTLVFDKKK